MKGLYGCLCLIFFASISYGQTITSAQNGTWNQGSTWVGGVVPTSANSSSIVIQHLVNVPNSYSVTVDQVFVDIFATLTVDTGGTLTVTDDGSAATDLDVYNDGFDYGFLSVSGTLICNNNAIITGTDGTNASFNSGGVYRHLYTTTEGSIPNANWDLNSTLQIQGYTGNITASVGLAGNWGQNFGNLVFNCSSLGTGIVQLQGQLTNVQNDLTISSTGTTGSFRFSGAQNPTISIGRDLIITGTSRVLFGTGINTIINIGRDFLFNSTNSTGTNFASTGASTINVIRDFSMNAPGGRLNFASSGSGILNVSQNFTLTAGSIFFGSASSATGTLNITGNFTNSGTLDEGSSSLNAGAVNFVGSGVHTFSNSGSINNTINFSVAALSTLDLGTSFITGSGTFTLNGTVRLGSIDAAGALQAGAGGNIRVTGSRIYATNSTIVYNGTGAQFIGDGFPASGVVNLTINNSNGVTLSTSLDIVALSVLTLTSGNIVIGTQTLTINGTVSGSGGIIGGPSSNLVIGGTGNFGVLTFNGTNELFNFTLNRGSSGLVTLGGNLTILGTFTHTAGTLAVAGNTLTISGAYGPSTPDGLSVTNSSTVIVNGTGTLPSDVAFTGTDLGTLTLNRGSEILPTTSSIIIQNLNLFSGTFSNGTGIAIATGGTITRLGGASAGSMTTSPNNTTNAYNVVYTSGALTTGPELPSNTTALANLSKTGTGALTLGSNITINGTLTLTNGSFNAGLNTIDFKGNFISSAASTLTSSPITFSVATTISGNSSPTFGVITITGTLTPNVNYGINGNVTNTGTLNAGTGSVTFGGNTTISGGTNSFNGLTIAASSALTAPSGTIKVAGNFTNNGTFTHNGGSVVFDGTSTVDGSIVPTFHRVVITGTFNAPANLNLNGNLNLNDGIFNHNSGTVTFNGTVTQNLNRTTGSGTIAYDLFNVTVNKASGAFFVESGIAGTTFRVENQFAILQNGTANTDVDFDGSSEAGTLVLGSSSTRTARIPAVPIGTTVVGNLTVERYIPNTDGIRAYRYLAPPVIGSTVADWQNEIPITGTFSNPSSGAGIPNPNSPSMYRYLETNGGTENNRYQAYPNNIALPASSFSLANGTGYAIYVRSTGTPTLNTRGTLRTGDFPVAVTITGTEVDAAGFNLVGNPYPTPIDWDLITLPPAISSTISIKDNVDNAGAGTGNFVYYVQAGPNVGGFTGIVASGQAFWVETTSNATLTFSETHKASDINPILVRQQQIADVLRIKIHGNGKEDESVIWLKEEATDGADLRFDAKKKTNDYLNLYSYLESSPDVKYAINGVGNFGCSKTFKLGISDLNSTGVNVVPAGTYTFNFSEFETFNEDYNFSLIDKFTNAVLDVKNNTEYVFEITTDPVTFGDDRFEIMITQPEIQTDNVIHFNDVCENSAALITIENTQSSIFYEARDQQGQVISDVVAGNGNAAVLSIPKEKLMNGINNLLVYAKNNSCDPVPLTQAVSLKVNEIYSVQSVVNASSCQSGSITLKASGIPSDGQYYWYETETATESVGTGSEWTTPLLQKSKTYYVAARNSLNCEGARVPVKAEVIQYDAAAISEIEGLLRSSYAENNQWYLNNTAIPGATNQEIIPDKSGIYKVEVNISGCTTSAEYEFSVTDIEDANLLKVINVYPNPIENKVSVELNNTEPAVARIMNSVGAPIGSIPFNIDGNRQKGEFDFGSEPAGLYLIKIVQDKKVINYKVIKK